MVRRQPGTMTLVNPGEGFLDPAGEAPGRKQRRGLPFASQLLLEGAGPIRAHLHGGTSAGVVIRSGPSDGTQQAGGGAAGKTTTLPGRDGPAHSASTAVVRAL